MTTLEEETEYFILRFIEKSGEYKDMKARELARIILSNIEKRIDSIKDQALRSEGITKISSPELSQFQKGYAKGVLMFRIASKEILK